MLDKALLRKAQILLQKTAYAPPAPPPMDPAAAGGMPMDPAAMGGMPPAPPMDPAMMGGMPPAPPMDPAAMGAMPPVDPATGMPMDPAAMGGMPPAPPMDPATGMPMDPAMMGMPPAPPMDPAAMGGMPIMLNMEDLKAVLAEASGGQDVSARMDVLEEMLTGIMQKLGLNPPEKAPEAAPAEASPEVPAAAPLDVSGMDAAPADPNAMQGFTEEAQKVASETVPNHVLWERENAAKRAPILATLKRLQVYK